MTNVELIAAATTACEHLKPQTIPLTPRVNLFMECQLCNGTGWAARFPWAREECKHCLGTGKSRLFKNDTSYGTESCQECGGRGYIPKVEPWEMIRELTNKGWRVKCSRREKRAPRGYWVGIDRGEVQRDGATLEESLLAAFVGATLEESLLAAFVAGMQLKEEVHTVQELPWRTVGPYD